MNKPKVRIKREPEDALQRRIMDHLALEGIESLATNWAKGRVVADAGVPDLILRRTTWPYGLVCLAEVKLREERGVDGKKLPGGKLSAEQERLSDAGWYAIVRSPGGALDWVEECERMHGLASPKRRVS